MTLIECENVKMSYEGVTAVSGISFALQSGELLSIVGENGSGKTTLMKGLLGLKSVESGSINYYDIKSSMIGYLPQQTSVQRDFPATVTEVVRSGCLNNSSFSPFYTRAQKDRADAAMEKMKLSHLKTRCYRELSGGQQQRVLLARALAATDKLLLLDEPVAGLDPKMTAEMYSLVTDLHKNQSVSIIMISHDIESAIRYSDKILHIHLTGSFFGTVDEYLVSDLYTNLGVKKNA